MPLKLNRPSLSVVTTSMGFSSWPGLGGEDEGLARATDASAIPLFDWLSTTRPLNDATRGDCGWDCACEPAEANRRCARPSAKHNAPKCSLNRRGRFMVPATPG